MSDKPPFEFVPLDVPPAKKPPVFDFAPLTPVTQPKKENKSNIGKSPNGYISHVSNHPEIVGATESIGVIDVTRLGDVAAYCSESRDAFEGYRGDLKHGQDAAAVILLDNTYVLVDADGVSQSYMAEIAAQKSTSAVAEEPSADLHRNILTAENALKQTQITPPTGRSLLDDALRQLLATEGSSTTFNQVTVDVDTGQVDGLIAGDGGLSFVRANGTREHYFFVENQTTGSVNSRLSSKHGFRGSLRRLRDIVGNDLRLNSWDSILLYSDSLQHKVGDGLIIDRVCDILLPDFRKLVS